jgi:hypothetical protein
MTGLFNSQHGGNQTTAGFHVRKPIWTGRNQSRAPWDKRMFLGTRAARVERAKRCAATGESQSAF